MRFPLLLFHLIVVWSLVLRGVRWVGAIPLLGIMLLIVWYYQRQQYVSSDVHISYKDLFDRYGMSVAWAILLLGVWQLLRIFGLLTYATSFWLLGAHMLLFLGAIVLHKKDLQTVAHVGRWISGLLLIVQSFQFQNGWLVVDMISTMIALSCALYACTVFVLGSVGYKIDRFFPAVLFVFSQLTIVVGVVYYIDSFTLWTLLGGQIYLGVVYSFLYRLYQMRTDTTPRHLDSDDDLLHVILRGDHVGDYQQRLLPSSSLRSVLLQAGQEIVTYLPARAFRGVASINGLLMLIQLILVLWGMTGEAGLWIDVGFWVSVAVYIMNYFVIQQQKIEARGQREMTFLLVNFGIYLTIYHLFGNNPIYMVICGIIRSIGNAGAMIHLRSSSLASLLSEKDYQYRLFGNIVAILANSYFIVLLPLSAQLKFTLIMIYLAIQTLLLRYQMGKR